MIRLYFYVEGQTEQTYAETVLRDHLVSFGVYVEGGVLAATRSATGSSTAAADVIISP
jgi:hypothetical protein